MKTKVLLLLFIAACTVFAGCQKDVTSGGVTDGKWYADGDVHWQLEGEKRISEGEHKIAPGDFDCKCTVCGYQILKYEPNTYVSEFDSYGNYKSTVTYYPSGKTALDEFNNLYDENGKLISQKIVSSIEGEIQSESETKYEYDTYGNLISETSYVDGVYQSSSVYGVNPDGSKYSETHYEQDGSSKSKEYDDKGNTVKTAQYLSDGSPEYANIYLYEYDENGQVVTHSERYEKYENGALSQLWEYNTKAPGVMPNLVKKTFYYGDEGLQEITYSERGNELSITSFDAEGKIFHEEIYEYEYDSDGNKTAYREYVNSILQTEDEYTTTPDTNSTYKSKSIHYDAESKCVTLYSPDGEIISEVVYDFDGNIIDTIIGQ